MAIDAVEELGTASKAFGTRAARMGNGDGGSRPTRRPAAVLAKLAFATALACVSSTAVANTAVSKYNVLAPGMHWATDTMAWRYAPSGQPAWATPQVMVPLIQQAMATWSAQCGVQFNYLGTTDAQAVVEDAVSIIAWVPTLAYGAVTRWYARGGALVEADIQINVATAGTAYATLPLVVHEVGHAIGLAHSAVADAVMAGPPAAAAYSYATVLDPDDVAGCQALYGPARGAPGAGLPQAAFLPALGAADAFATEFYHPVLDHYFITADSQERDKLMTGGPDGHWRATSRTFKVWSYGQAGLQAMCRFYGDSSTDPATGKRRGPDSHFYTADPTECQLVPQKWPVWIFEGNAFYAALPDEMGLCPSGSVPVQRFFKPTGDPNHRYVTDAVAAAEMVQRGWLDEGVRWCAGQ